MTKVAIRRCEEYDVAKVKDALGAALSDIGGLGAYVRPGERVLLKANLLMRKRPEQAATTHPAVVRALAEMLTALGCEVTIGDSPGGPFTAAMLNNVYKGTGMIEAARAAGVKLNENVGSCKRENPDGLLLKALTVADMVREADKVISVAKLKTHGMMTMTGAVKNMFGIVPGVVKAEYHLNMRDYDDFANALVDICLCGAPVLSVMDGIVGMEGEGPSAGTTRQVGALMVSASPYHLDKTACALIGIAPADVPVLKACIARGICGEGLEDVEIMGETLESFGVEPFKLPTKGVVTPGAGLPAFVVKLLNKHVQPRPVFKHDVCTGCRVCEQSCPPKVITMKEKRPVAALDGCIRCYCCQELCPEKAVAVVRPWLLSLSWVGVYAALAGRRGRGRK